MESEWAKSPSSVNQNSSFLFPSSFMYSLPIYSSLLIYHKGAVLPPHFGCRRLSLKLKNHLSFQIFKISKNRDDDLVAYNAVQRFEPLEVNPETIPVE